tara:strand:+ start:885 stop:1175 length:291 start_codon:yes stop_codon:yes gene_type:complete
MDNFGSRLKTLRTKQGLLMRQVAAAADVDTSMISKFENGDRLPTRKQIEKLALILKVPEEELLIQAYSEKIAYDLIKEPLAEEIIELALKKLQLKK